MVANLPLVISFVDKPNVRFMLMTSNVSLSKFDFIFYIPLAQKLYFDCFSCCCVCQQRACEEALYGLRFFSSRPSPGDNMALKRSTSVHQGKLDSSGNEPSMTSSSHSGKYNIGMTCC